MPQRLRQRLDVKAMIKTLLATIGIFIVGVSTIHASTDRFSAFTAEGARRYSAINNPNSVLPIQLTTHTGEATTYFGNSDQILVVEFIFTHCPEVCQTLGRSFFQLQEKVRAIGIDDRVQFVSVSFDPEYDHVPELAAFAERHQARSEMWRVARPQTDDDLQYLLKTFGVVVIDDPFLRYVHNAGLHFVSPAGNLVAILDADDVEGGIELIKAAPWL